MASQQNYIDNLPDKVLCMVFDRLDFENVKNASLTCKRWNGVIFHSAYTNRFFIQFSIFNLGDQKMNTTKYQLWKAKQLKRTGRRYCNFSFLVVWEMEEAFPQIWKEIELNHVSNLKWLNLCFVGNELPKLLPLVINAVPSMPQLRTLDVLDQTTVRLMAYEHVKQDDIPVIRSKSIQELTMFCKYRYTVDLPELRKFAGALCGLLPPDSGDKKESLVYGNLKDLEVKVVSWQSNDLSIFRRMPNLVKIHWEIPVEDEVFEAICKSCASLTEARFSKDLLLSGRSVLNLLSKLAQLRRLTFANIHMQQDVFMDLSKLKHLEELELGHTHLLPISLLSISKTIRKLGLHINRGNETSLVEIVVRNLTQLTELHLDYYSAPIKSSVLRALPTLGHVEVLKFSHCYFTKSNFLEMSAPMPRLRTLLFKNCNLETKQLVGLQDKFPNLKNTEFEECYAADVPEEDQDLGPQYMVAKLAERLNVPVVPYTEIYR